jgi:hypothetical protein
MHRVSTVEASLLVANTAITLSCGQKIKKRRGRGKKRCSKKKRKTWYSRKHAAVEAVIIWFFKSSG